MSTDTGDAPDDEEVESMEAAMGGTGQQDQDTTTHVPEADRIGYEEMVVRAAEYLRDGVVELSQIQPKPYHDVSESEFLGDVREMLDEADDTEEAETTSNERDVDTVDWEALWDQFGFDTPDVDGNQYVSQTQLLGALECADQACPSGKPTITQAVEDGQLHKLTTDGAEGETVTRGYVWTKEGDSR